MNKTMFMATAETDYRCFGLGETEAEAIHNLKAVSKKFGYKLCHADNWRHGWVSFIVFEFKNGQASE